MTNHTLLCCVVITEVLQATVVLYCYRTMTNHTLLCCVVITEILQATVVLYCYKAMTNHTLLCCVVAELWKEPHTLQLHRGHSATNPSSAASPHKLTWHQVGSAVTNHMTILHS